MGVNWDYTCSICKTKLRLVPCPICYPTIEMKDAWDRAVADSEGILKLRLRAEKAEERVKELEAGITGMSKAAVSLTGKNIRLEAALARLQPVMEAAEELCGYLSKLRNENRWPPDRTVFNGLIAAVEKARGEK